MTSRGSSIGRGTRGALALALTALACLLAPSGALAATGSISGTVTDAFTHAAIEGVWVCAESETDWGCDQTFSDGTYGIAGLEPGTYKVEFWPEGLNYLPQYYDGKSSWFEADPVVVGSGAASGIDAELVAGAGIEGTVTRTSDNSPVEEVEVCAWEAVDGEFAGCDWTAADGTYLIPRLDPGEYIVEFWPGGSGQNLAVQFYDQEDRWSDADPVSVAAGETMTGIDAALAPGATLAGNVSSLATGLPLEEIRVCSIDAASGALWICTWTNWKGNYSLPFHSAGAYKVVFSPELREWFGEESLPEYDGYPTQFWNNQTTLAAANEIGLASGGFVAGIDARLGPPAAQLPVIAPTVTPRRHRHKCRRGFRRKLAHGKRRCVRIRHRHRKHRHRPRAEAQRTELAAPGLLSR